MEKKKVLVIDPEPMRLGDRLNRLKEECVVHVAISLAQALKYSAQYGFDFYDLIFMEPLMSNSSLSHCKDAAEFTSDKTKDGLLTGEVFYDKYMKHARTKIIIWACSLEEYKNKKWPENVVSSPVLSIGKVSHTVEEFEDYRKFLVELVQKHCS